MSAKVPVTVLIPTYNEEENIAEAIASVTWAAEILIVDSYSTDRTLDIVRGLPGVRIIQRAYEYSASQKNWSIPQAAFEWVFVLDADERCTPALADEIQALFGDASGPGRDVYYFPRREYFLGKELKYTLRSSRIARFFRRDACRYEDLHVHAKLRHPDNAGQLSSILLHQTFRSSEHYFWKITRYAGWAARDYADRTPRVTGYHLVVKPFVRFVKHYIVNRGFLDGRAGLMFCVILSWTVFMRYFRLAELRWRGELPA